MAVPILGMCDYKYLVCDGGPHLVIPRELGSFWTGVGSDEDVLSLATDYGRACAAVGDENEPIAIIAVGHGHALVLSDPPASAWGHSPHGWVDFYDLEFWSEPDDFDDLIGRAVAATPTGSMSDSGKVFTLDQGGLILMFAGDCVGSAVYGECEVPIGTGSYRILGGHYDIRLKEEVYIYRLQPF